MIFSASNNKFLCKRFFPCGEFHMFTIDKEILINIAFVVFVDTATSNAFNMTTLSVRPNVVSVVPDLASNSLTSGQSSLGSAQSMAKELTQEIPLHVTQSILK